MIRTLTAALTLCLTALTPALAERGNKDLKRNCVGDATTFCADVDPGSRAMDACFRKHREELSGRCRRAIDAYQAGRRK